MATSDKIGWARETLGQKNEAGATDARIERLALRRETGETQNINVKNERIASVRREAGIMRCDSVGLPRSVTA